jgi:CRP-like cAMP-binding protein
MTAFPGPPDRLVREAAWVARCVGRADTVPFTDADLDALASSLARREFQQGSVLFTQAAPPAGVWIIQRGSVELAVRSGRRRAVVALLRPGDVEGDVALVLGKPPPYTARAREATVCLFLDAGDFRRLLRRHPAIAQRWLTSCAIRLARSHARILELLEGSLLQRVARLLLDEAVEGHVLLPQRTLAAMLGVHRQSFNKTLKDLEARRAIVVAYADIQILDTDALTRVVAGPRPEARVGRSSRLS